MLSRVAIFPLFLGMLIADPAARQYAGVSAALRQVRSQVSALPDEILIRYQITPRAPEQVQAVKIEPGIEQRAGIYRAVIEKKHFHQPVILHELLVLGHADRYENQQEKYTPIHFLSQVLHYAQNPRITGLSKTKIAQSAHHPAHWLSGLRHWLPGFHRSSAACKPHQLSRQSQQLV